MKTNIFLSLLLFCNVLCAQWQGDLEKYTVTNDNLQLNDTESGEAYLSKASDVIENATWEFRVQLGFDPSSSNYAAVYLTSANVGLDGNGYFVKIGDTKDDISLYRQDGDKATKIIDGEDGAVKASAVNVKIRVTHIDGVWSLYRNVADTGEQLEGTVTDETHQQSSYFGVKAVYTKTRADKFTFSKFNITGTGFVDDAPPSLSSINVLNKNTLSLSFNENIFCNYVKCNDINANTISVIDNKVLATFTNHFPERDSFIVDFEVKDLAENMLKSQQKAFYIPFEVIAANIEDSEHLSFKLNKNAKTVNTEHITINGKNPLSISFSDDKYLIALADEIEKNTTITLQINNIEDENGDKLKTYNSQISYFEAEFGNVVFNEIMADPEPIIGNLPEYEYLELYNSTEFAINLEDWTLAKETDSCDFPAYQFNPKEYLVIGSEDAIDALPNNINKLAVSGFITLNNTDLTLLLKSKIGALIDIVNYKSSWHEDAFKAAGGFSLERIDVNNLSEIDNWTSSCDANGGTPGFKNSVAADNPDNISPAVAKLYADNNISLKVEYSEPIFTKHLKNTQNYTLSDDLNISLVITSKDISTQATLYLSEHLDSGKIYEIKVDNILDISGNEMEKSSHKVAVCHSPKEQEIVINELMFYPLYGEAEYIELYNTMDIPFDLSKIFLTQRDDYGNWEIGKALSDYPQILEPESFIVLTNESEMLQNQYEIEDEKLLEISSFPSLGNESGNFGILLSNATVIDKLNYSESLHSTALSDTRGVALERINPTVATDIESNWFSASFIQDYGTPGRINSQYKIENTPIEPDKCVTLDAEYFTPDGDGNADFLKISINSKHEDSRVRIQIFNQRAVVVKEMLNNTYLGANSTIIWDGTDSSGARCPMGPYIIWVEIVTADGEVITEKLEVVVSARVR